MNKHHLTTFLISAIMITVFIPAYGDNLGSVAVNLRYTNGDIADYWPVSLKIYQDFGNTPFKEIGSLSANPFNIVSLPIGHKYKIESQVNSMQSGVVYVDLQQQHQDVTMNVPLPGGLRVNVFYNDGTTPITNATVFIRSEDNKTWAHSPVNNGQSVRFWVAPTISYDDYYIADIKIGNHLVYPQSQIRLQPGVPQEVKIITNWPPVINGLITVKLHDIQGTKTKLLVDMFDANDHKITESPVSSHGEAYFSNMLVGDYSFVAMDSSNNTTWGKIDTTIDGSKSHFEIFEIQKLQSNNTSLGLSLTIKTSTNTMPHPIQNCGCVAFRLDAIQDYWLDTVQTKIMDTFYQKNQSLTIGIIGNAFGNDQRLVDQIKTEKDKIDIAVNGWNFEDFSGLDELGQETLAKQAKDKISLESGRNPEVFIPPYGKINDNTFVAISNVGLSTLSTSSDVTTPSNLHSFPAKIFAGDFINKNVSNPEFLSNIRSAINNNGFAVITLNFQDFAQNNDTAKMNVPDLNKITRLADLIDNLQSNKIKIVSISEIASNMNQTHTIPSWIKNNAKWWSDGSISDDEFIKGIQYLIQNGMIRIPSTQVNNDQSHTIPSWIKNNAKWWSDGSISDDEFIKGIQYLIQNGIIKV